MDNDMLKVIIARDQAYGERTFAVLRCKRTDQVGNASNVRHRLKQAVREWAATPAGRAAMASTNFDFNLGDVTAYDESLRPFVAKAGLEEFTIDVFSDAEPNFGWSYDDVLTRDDGDDDEEHDA